MFVRRRGVAHLVVAGNMQQGLNQSSSPQAVPKRSATTRAKHVEMDNGNEYLTKSLVKQHLLTALSMIHIPTPPSYVFDANSTVGERDTTFPQASRSYFKVPWSTSTSSMAAPAALAEPTIRASLTDLSMVNEKALLETFGMFSVQHGHWLETERPLAEYQIRFSKSSNTHVRNDSDVIEIQAKSNFIKSTGLEHYAQGLLQKKGKKSLVWLDRFFVLKNFVLSYSKSPSDLKLTGSIDLTETYNSRLIHDSNGSVELQIVTLSKTYRMRSDDVSELRHWIRILWSIHASIHGVGLLTNRPGSPDYESEDSESTCEDIMPDFPDNPSHENTRMPFLKSFSHLRVSDASVKSQQQQQQQPTSASSSPLIPPGQPALAYSDIKGDKIGFLYKKGNLNRSFKYRLFVLRDKILYYYRLADRTGSLSLLNTMYQYAGMINLEGSRVFSSIKTGKKAYNFKIVAPSRVFTLSSAHKDDWEDWKDAFEYISGIKTDSAENSGDETVTTMATAATEKPYKPKLKLDFERHGQPDFSGYLLKQGNDRIGQWRKRWFVLLGRTLFYCNSPDSEPLGSVPLSISEITRIHDTEGDHSFEITVRNADLSDPVLRTFRLRAYDSESLKQWTQRLLIFTSSVQGS